MPLYEVPPRKTKPELPRNSHAFEVVIPVRVDSGPGGTRGDARQAGDNFINEVLRPALDKMNGPGVEVDTARIRKADHS